MPPDGRLEREGGVCPSCGHNWPLKPAVKIITGTLKAWLHFKNCEVCGAEIVILDQPADELIKEAMRSPHRFMCGFCAQAYAPRPVLEPGAAPAQSEKPKEGGGAA
jgi:hypothetical protein